MCPTLDSNQHLRLHAGALPLDQWNIWWTIPDSNRSPQACKASALPDELMAHMLDLFMFWWSRQPPSVSYDTLKIEVFVSPGPLARLVGNKGLEPLRLAALEPKSSASTNSANSPYLAITVSHLPLWYFKGFTWQLPTTPQVLLYSRLWGVIESAMAYIYEKLHS